jgi:enolase-phosphatase E1
MFPLSLERLDDYLGAHGKDADVAGQLDALWQRVKLGEKTGAERQRMLSDILKGYIRDDVKDGTLKWIQGRIWKAAFETGALTGHMYPEVGTQLREWKAAGLKLYIYSSGSIEAQKLMFGYSVAGDLTGLLDGYFDTGTGPKRESASYSKIADSISIPPTEILFLSDVTAELDAATTAGMQTCLLLREGAQAPESYLGASAKDFGEVHAKFF